MILLYFERPFKYAPIIFFVIYTLVTVKLKIHSDIFFLLDGNLIDKDTEFLHWMM